MTKLSAPLHPILGECYWIAGVGVMRCVNRSTKQPTMAAFGWIDSPDPKKISEWVSISHCSAMTHAQVDNSIAGHRAKFPNFEEWDMAAPEWAATVHASIDRIGEGTTTNPRYTAYRLAHGRTMESEERIDLPYSCWLSDRRTTYEKLSKALHPKHDAEQREFFFDQWLALGWPNTVEGLRQCEEIYEALYESPSVF